MDDLISPQELEAFCRKWKIAELRLFGSAARGEMRPDSDVDLLYRFDEDSKHNLFDLQDIEEELSKLFQRDVDFISYEAVQGSHNPYRKAGILADARIVFPHAA